MLAINEAYFTDTVSSKLFEVTYLDPKFTTACTSTKTPTPVTDAVRSLESGNRNIPQVADHILGIAVHFGRRIVTTCSSVVALLQSSIHTRSILLKWGHCKPCLILTHLFSLLIWTFRQCTHHIT